MDFENPRITALYNKYYVDKSHPYHIYEGIINRYLTKDMTVLDAGCGRDAPVITGLKNSAKKLIGVDLVSFGKTAESDNIELLNSNLESLPVKSQSVDMVICRSVLEHLEYPELVFKEFNRVLKKGGFFVFLAPNFGDYVSIISRIIPNRLHPLIMSVTEGRDEADTFPTYYRANTFKQISDLAFKTNFDIAFFEYLGQYPSNFTFSSLLFFLATIYDKWVAKYNSLRFLRAWILGGAKKI